MLREQRAPELAYEKAIEYASLAKTSLDVFPPSRERDALQALADYVTSRDR
jgi:geranylgeranyl pyrophosphate synthase